MSGIDPVWEKKYAAGHRQRYPWDIVVSFVFRNAPKDRQRTELSILEVGCGTGSNLWFAAREGFRVAGVDGSASAIETARSWFHSEGLEGDLRVGDFSALPFPDQAFDLAIDRGALTCVGFEAGRRAVAEVRRVLKPGGRFLFNPYADNHASRRLGRQGADGLTVDIAGGTMVGVGGVCFYGAGDIRSALASGWEILSMQRSVLTDEIEGENSCHAEWRVVAERRPD